MTFKQFKRQIRSRGPGDYDVFVSQTIAPKSPAVVNIVVGPKRVKFRPPVCAAPESEKFVRGSSAEPTKKKLF